MVLHDVVPRERPVYRDGSIRDEDVLNNIFKTVGEIREKLRAIHLGGEREKNTVQVACTRATAAERCANKRGKKGTRSCPSPRLDCFPACRTSTVDGRQSTVVSPPVACVGPTPGRRGARVVDPTHARETAGTGGDIDFIDFIDFIEVIEVIEFIEGDSLSVAPVEGFPQQYRALVGWMATRFSTVGPRMNGTCCFRPTPKFNREVVVLEQGDKYLWQAGDDIWVPVPMYDKGEMLSQQRGQDVSELWSSRRERERERGGSNGRVAACAKCTNGNIYLLEDSLLELGYDRLAAEGGLSEHARESHFD